METWRINTVEIDAICAAASRVQLQPSTELHLELLVVEKGVLVSNAKEEPGEALEVLARGGSLR